MHCSTQNKPSAEPNTPMNSATISSMRDTYIILDLWSPPPAATVNEVTVGEGTIVRVARLVILPRDPTVHLPRRKGQVAGMRRHSDRVARTEQTSDGHPHTSEGWERLVSQPQPLYGPPLIGTEGIEPSTCHPDVSLDANRLPLTFHRTPGSSHR